MKSLDFLNTNIFVLFYAPDILVMLQVVVLLETLSFVKKYRAQAVFVSCFLSFLSSPTNSARFWGIFFPQVTVGCSLCKSIEWDTIYQSQNNLFTPFHCLPKNRIIKEILMYCTLFVYFLYSRIQVDFLISIVISL